MQPSPPPPPPFPAIWHPPLAVHNYLKLFGSQSVPGLLFLMSSESTLQRSPLFLTRKVSLIHSHSFLPSVWNLNFISKSLFILNFVLPIILSCAFCLCASVIPRYSLCILKLIIFLRCQWLFTVTSLSFYHLTFTALFFAICQSLCLSPNLVPFQHPQKKLRIYKDYCCLAHQHFCCHPSVSCSFVMFRGKVLLKGSSGFKERESQVCLHKGGVGVE